MFGSSSIGPAIPDSTAKSLRAEMPCHEENTHMSIKNSLAIVTGMLMGLAGTAVPALALTSINSCPANITAPGTYQLTSNLACTVSITASNVNLKLNGFTIAPASGDGIDVNGGG